MEHKFKVYSPLTSKSVENFITKSDEATGERILLEGVASTTSRDLQDEIVSKEAIESMAEQAMMKGLNIHGDHWYNLADVIGAIKDATVEDEQLKIKFLITKKYTPDIKDLLETGVKLGLSIGGYVKSYDEKNRIINAIELHEISLTAMPANWDTFGTVTSSKGLVESNCITGACYEIVKNLNGVKMTTEEMQTKEETTETSDVLTTDAVIALINEYMAEKEETIAQEITDKVEAQLGAIVDAKLEELKEEDDTPKEEEDEEVAETKAESEEDKEEDDAEATTESEEPEEEDDDEKEKSIITSEMIAETINKGIADALGDDFAEKVASKMFGNLDQTRTNKGSKFEEFMKAQTEEPVEEPVAKSTYSTKEAAEMLLAKQKRSNPIMAAAMKNLR